MRRGPDVGDMVIPLARFGLPVLDADRRPVLLPNGEPKMELADPTTVTHYVRHPDGTLDTYTAAAAQLDHPGTGLYERPQIVDDDGTWGFIFVATGAVTAAVATEIVVRRNPLLPLNP
jgi:hypothetical protein